MQKGGITQKAFKTSVDGQRPHAGAVIPTCICMQVSGMHQRLQPDDAVAFHFLSTLDSQK